MNKRLAILLIGIGVGLLAGGCAVPASPSSVAPPASPHSLGTTPSSPPSLPASSPDPSPSEPASGDIDPSTILQICAGLPDAVDGEPIWCDDLVRTALEGTGSGEPVTRVETSYTCATSCRPPDPDRGYVLVTSQQGTVEVEVARQADGSFAVVAITPFAAPDPSPFDPPATSALAIDDAPAVVNGRQPLPLCGVEAGSAYGPFDTEARQCFWDGVRAGSAVEFISSHPDTEGLLVTTIHRYAGTGGVEVIANDEGGWYRMATGVGPAREAGRVFDLAGLTDREPIPAE